MPLGQLPGMVVPDKWADVSPPAFGSSLLIDAAGEKAAICGRVYFTGGGTKNISSVGFRWGALTKPALATLTLSLQDVSLTTGMPDETQDQTATITLSAQTQNTATAITLGTTRAVSNSTRLAVVWEYLNFVATSSVVICALPGQIGNQECYNALKSGAGPTWAFITAAASLIPNILLGFDDGTYGTLMGTYACVDGLASITLSTGTGTETGNLIRPAAAGVIPPGATLLPGIIEGIWAFVDMDGDLDISIYEASTVLAAGTLVETIHFDKDVRNFTNARLLWAPLVTPKAMLPGRVYYVAMSGPTATAATAYEIDMLTGADIQAFPGGSEITQVARATVGSGAWTGGTGRSLCGVILRGANIPARSAGLV